MQVGGRFLNSKRIFVLWLCQIVITIIHFYVSLIAARVLKFYIETGISSIGSRSLSVRLIIFFSIHWNARYAKIANLVIESFIVLWLHNKF